METTISWQLDGSGDEVSSDVLPAGPFNLSDWDQVFGLTMEARDHETYTSFFVRANVTATSFCGPSTLAVAIDIKPGTSPNQINLSSSGTVPIAILSSPSFDAAAVNPATVTVAGAPVKAQANGALMTSLADVNQDGLLDRVVHVAAQAMQLASGDTEAVLSGSLLDGTGITGTDRVTVVN